MPLNLLIIMFYSVIIIKNNFLCHYFIVLRYIYLIVINKYQRLRLRLILIFVRELLKVQI
jgi:hypothetical protein